MIYSIKRLDIFWTILFESNGSLFRPLTVHVCNFGCTVHFGSHSNSSSQAIWNGLKLNQYKRCGSSSFKDLSLYPERSKNRIKKTIMWNWQNYWFRKFYNFLGPIPIRLFPKENLQLKLESDWCSWDSQLGKFSIKLKRTIGLQKLLLKFERLWLELFTRFSIP